MNSTHEEYSFDDHFEGWMKRLEWIRHVASWWPHRHEDWLLWLHYETMSSDLPGTIDRIADFLGWTLTDERRRTVIERSSFRWMKANSARFVPHAMKRPNDFIRKGRVGSYSELMTDEQAERLVQQARRHLEPDCLVAHGLAREGEA